MPEAKDATWSCRFIEAAASFHYSSVHICSVPHHGTGQPLVAQFTGGAFPLVALLEKRAEIQAANQTPAGYPACAGCALLERKVWPERKYPLDYLGLGNWIYCNIECSYCELQTKGLAAKSIAFEPYLVFETVLGLLEQGHLDPKATVDWGAGASPPSTKTFRGCWPCSWNLAPLITFTPTGPGTRRR